MNEVSNEIWWLVIVDYWQPKEKRIISPIKRKQLTMQIIEKMSAFKSKRMIALNE